LDQALTGNDAGGVLQEVAADAIKTLKFSAHDSVTPPDASITSHAAPRGALGRRLIFAQAFINDLPQ
jgi:hypothetical protein